MTSIREAVKRMLGRAKEEEARESPAPATAYRFYWTKEVRTWSVERRREMRGRVASVVGRENFEATTYERRYAVQGLDELRHAGASLQALLAVLDGFEEFGQQAEEAE